MVIPSFSTLAPCRPHIGSDFGGGTFLAAIPDSQCPAALPAQQGIELILSSEAFAMRNGSAATKRHRKHSTPSDRTLCLLCFIVAIDVKLLSRTLRDRLPNELHSALWTETFLLRGHLLVHRADIAEWSGLAGMRRAFLLYCCDDRDRVHRGTGKKQRGGEEQHDRKAQAIHFYSGDQASSCSRLISRKQEECFDSGPHWWVEFG